MEPEGKTNHHHVLHVFSSPESGSLQLVEEQELLAPHRRLLYQLPEAGVVLGRRGVDDPRQSRQEAGQTVLHLLCWIMQDVK